MIQNVYELIFLIDESRTFRQENLSHDAFLLNPTATADWMRDFSSGER